jgi:hypothetical protein
MSVIERSLEMKKTMILLGVVLCATLLVNPALACDGKEAKNASNDGSSCSKTAAAQASNEGATCSKSDAVKASNEGATCSKSAAKAAYAKTLEATGCEKTAQTAYKNTLAENVYAKSYAETSCSKTAEKTAYAAVYAETSCEKSSQTAATHAVAQASYNATYAKTGCEKTAQAAYASITKTAGASCATAAEKASCDKGNAESATDKVAEADVKVASNEEGSSR